VDTIEVKDGMVESGEPATEREEQGCNVSSNFHEEYMHRKSGTRDARGLVGQEEAWEK